MSGRVGTRVGGRVRVRAEGLPGVHLSFHERLDAVGAVGRDVGGVDRVRVDDHSQQLSRARPARVSS